MFDSSNVLIANKSTLVWLHILDSDAASSNILTANRTTQN